MAIHFRAAFVAFITFWLAIISPSASTTAARITLRDLEMPLMPAETPSSDLPLLAKYPKPIFAQYHHKLRVHPFPFIPSFPRPGFHYLPKLPELPRLPGLPSLPGLPKMPVLPKPIGFAPIPGQNEGESPNPGQNEGESPNPGLTEGEIKTKGAPIPGLTEGESKTKGAPIPGLPEGESKPVSPP